MSELIVLCGVSHAGKTTYAEKMCEIKDYKIINTDNIRIKLHGSREIKSDEFKVWALFEKAKTDAINDGEDIILDACHISPQARWHAKKNLNGHKVKIIVFDVAEKELKRRCKKEKRIKWAIIKNMVDSFNISKTSLIYEGYQNIQFIN